MESQTIKAHGDTFQVEIDPKKSIRVFGVTLEGLSFDTTFKIGDKAEYDSFNLSYIGTIKSISTKRVCVEKKYTGSKNKVRQLSITEFCWRNYHFDLAQVEAANNEMSARI